jgi:hypothetical protein
VLRYAAILHKQLISLEIDTINKFLKIATVVQNNLELLGYNKFEYNEYVYMIHTAVNHFLLRGLGLEGQGEVIEEQGVVTETPSATEFSCYVNENNAKGILGIRHVPNVMIGDSGASCHMTCTDEGMFDCRPISYVRPRSARKQ